MKKKATSKDVAKLAGVSQSTVSFVLNNRVDISISEETQRRVIEAARALDYRPVYASKALKVGGSKLIGVIIPNISNPFYHMMVQSIEEYSIGKGYGVFICNTNRNVDNEKRYLDLLEEKEVDAVIFGFTPFNYSTLTETAKRIPVIIIGEKDENIKLSTIALNSFKAGEIIAQHLIEFGHTNFAYVTSPMNKFSLSRQKRLNGIVSKLREYKLEKNLTIQTVPEEKETHDSTYEMEIGFELTSQILEDKKTTAIVGVNDMVALGVLNAITTNDLRVPNDYSICGFDNIYLTRTIKPRLTTIDHLVNHRCKMAIDMIFENGNKNLSEIFKVEYEPRLIARETTGPAK